MSYFPLVVKSGKGSIITDLDGNQFIDFLSSASSLNLGSTNPIVTEAIKKQLDEYSQYALAYVYNENNVAYAERLVSVYPGGVSAKVCFGNSGSDSNDAAIKFARGYTGRSKLISFLNGYHGSTYASSSMSSCSPKQHAKMGPFLPECYAFPFYGIDQPDDVVERDCLKEMKQAFNSYMSPEEVAAVFVEPIQGDGGMLPAHPIFMHQLYDFCKEHGILFISDEVQQGFWRTGKMFGIEHFGLIPDGIVMGKSIGAGLTLGAFMGRTEVMDALPSPAHSFTLGGNALSCAAGIAAFDYCQTDEFQSLLKSNSVLLEELADDLKAKHPDVVAFWRNIGMSMGIGIQDPDGPDGSADATFKILFRAYEKGLLVISLAGTVLRIQPPLNIEPELLKRGFAILDESMTDFENGLIPDDVLRYNSGW